MNTIKSSYHLPAREGWGTILFSLPDTIVIGKLKLYHSLQKIVATAIALALSLLSIKTMLSLQIASYT
jgi:hypothetical protein